MRSIIGTIVYSWVGEHVWVTQRMRENVIHPCLGLVAFLWSGKGAGPFSSPMLLKSGRIPRWRSLLLVWFGPAAFKQFNHPLELSWSLALPPFASDFSPRWATGRRFSNAIHHLWPVNTNSNQTAPKIFTFYILNTREIDTRAALWEALKYGASTLISSTATVALTPGNEHRQGDKTMNWSYAWARHRRPRQPEQAQKHSNKTLLSDTKL